MHNALTNGAFLAEGSLKISADSLPYIKPEHTSEFPNLYFVISMKWSVA